MLIVTDAAAAAFRSAMERRSLPRDGGIRLEPPVPGTASPSPVATLANEPTPGDAIVIDHGVRVFLDRHLVPLGGDVVIDVATDEQQRLGFVLRGPA
ncbi:MAG: hypothetical protein J2P59_11550 [Acidimicrobiales bacterium]|nr:hypothetical protein [Acidimicrobiales bacterium]MBO0887329.1 hypothetical protein [Acidimicrobiales bacterium]